MVSTADRIVELLRERRLSAGDPVPTEQELIAELGVARNTVREAIRELRTLGIVEVRHGFGTFVGPAALDAVSRTLVFRVISNPAGELIGMRELLDMRELIEVSMARRLAGTVSAERLATLRELAGQMADPRLRVQADRDFHRNLYAGQPNSLVGELVDVFWDAYHVVVPQLRELTEAAFQATARRHRRIVDALESGDPDAAATAMTEHFADLHERVETAAARAAGRASGRGSATGVSAAGRGLAPR